RRNLITDESMILNGLRSFEGVPTEFHSVKAATSILSFQLGGLESRLTRMSPKASLQIWMPAIHAGMTGAGSSSCVGERKLMNHFVLCSRTLWLRRGSPRRFSDIPCSGRDCRQGRA